MSNRNEWQTIIILPTIWLWIKWPVRYLKSIGMKNSILWLINISPAEPARQQKAKISLQVVENEIINKRQNGFKYSTNNDVGKKSSLLSHRCSWVKDSRKYTEPQMNWERFECFCAVLLGRLNFFKQYEKERALLHFGLYNRKYKIVHRHDKKKNMYQSHFSFYFV